MRRFFSHLLVISVLISFLPGASADYLGAESLDLHVVAAYGDSALLSLVYVPYSTSMSGTLVPTGYSYYNFYVNSSGAYLIGNSLEEPVVYWYRGFYYAFIPNEGSVEVYRMGEGCFERILTVKSRNNDSAPAFAVAVPYLVVQVSENEVLAANIARNVTVGTLDLREAESGTYFRGVTIVKEGNNIRLVGDSPEKPPTAMAVHVSGDALRIPEGNIELPLNSVGKYLWAREEAGHLRVYRLENALLLVPPSVTHYFAPNANSTGELLEFGNESVAVSDTADVYVLYYNGKLRPFPLGEPTGSRFLVKADGVRFIGCEVPRTYALEFWAAVVLLALIGFAWFLMVRRQ
ncbi:hypothetical protein [Thermococcus radiotolerans]|uniref:Uncharacterized protein n=1 Tax=Thermococcus radiotolerans TaxID=187880 RepID=A0A2Z2N0G8_9EURY|nr:hypothetical protein [Thermococcus radiotolerans]ASJ15044.1 hypothetical protein A3L10_07850 [Thermococcus radiotolerans]